jgi:Zn finger protein HypA/HybF involved in hydrogenase expression
LSVCPFATPRRRSFALRPATLTQTTPGHQEEIVAEKYEGYCVKCKEKREFDGEVSTSENGRRMAKGSCPVCSTKMNRILGKA